MSILLDDDLGLLDVISPHSSSSAPSSPTLSPHWKQPSTSTQHVTSSPLSLSSTTDDDDLFESSPQTQPLMFSPSVAPISMTRLPSLSMKTDESLPSLSMKTDDLFDPIIDTDMSARSEPRDIIRADVMSRIISDGMTTHMTDMMERGNEYDEMLTSQHQHILNALNTETSVFPAFQYGWPNETQAFTTSDVTQSQAYTAPVTEPTPSIKTEPVSAIAEPAPVVPVVAVVPTPTVNPTSPIVTRTTRRTRGSPTAASSAAAAATATPTSISVVVDPVTEPIVERRASASSAASLPAPASPLAGSRRARKRSKGSSKSTSPSRTTSSPTTSTTSTVTGRKRKKSTASIKKESDIEDDDESVTSKSTVVDKKQQRLERNRASAQLSRERRKNYMSQLEEQLRELTASNQTLTQQLNALDHENQALKKLIANKKAASTTPSSTPSETGAARSALLLFAVVISFGLFFHMAGLPQQTEPVGIRVQTSVPTPGPGPSVTTMHRSRVLSSIETESDKALVKLEKTVDSNARALVPIVKQEPGSDLGLALDVYKQDPSTGAITETTAPPTTPAEDPLIAYEKLLAGSNFTHDPDAAYMFCPSALQMHIQPRNDTVHTNYTPTSTSTSDLDSKRFQLVDEHAKRSRERSDRLRRVMGLSDDKSSIPIVYTSDRTSTSHGILPRRTVPGGVPSYDSIGADAAKMYLSSRSDRLLLWVPIRALKPQWEYNHTMADSSDSGLVEIDCRIDDIRPLLLA